MNPKAKSCMALLNSALQSDFELSSSIILNCLASPMMPFPPLEASLVLRASASCSGSVPAPEAVEGLELLEAALLNSTEENSL